MSVKSQIAVAVGLGPEVPDFVLLTTGNMKFNGRQLPRDLQDELNSSARIEAAAVSDA